MLVPHPAREGLCALNTGRPACSTGTTLPATGMSLPCMGSEARARIHRIPASSNARRRMRWNSVHMVFGVLIVDDNRLFLDAARGLLEGEGLRLTFLSSGTVMNSKSWLRSREVIRHSWCPGSLGSSGSSAKSRTCDQKTDCA
jgi:hypothetical protein